MFNLFSGKKDNNNAEVEAFKQELSALEQRWYSFLSKLEEKYNEVIEAIETEGPNTYQEDTDQFKRAFTRFKSGMNGQLESIRNKAYDTCETQIRNYYAEHDSSVMSPTHDILYEWRNRCLDAHNDWEDRIEAKKDLVWAKVAVVEDPEIKYQAILDEYESIKNKFSCKQCSSPISIDKIFFTSTYITCPACQTQNTFEPSSQARMLEHIARELAEKRTAHLQAAYNAEKQLSYDLYNQMHELKYDQSVPENIKKTKLAEMENRKQQAEKEAPDMYRNYLRAMFDEWNALIPDLKEQNEKFYLRQLEDFNKFQ